MSHMCRQQCWCGDNEVKDVYKAKEEDCNLKCTGDSNANCGGIWRLNLYRTGNKGKFTVLVERSPRYFKNCIKLKFEIN